MEKAWANVAWCLVHRCLVSFDVGEKDIVLWREKWMRFENWLSQHRQCFLGTQRTKLPGTFKTWCYRWCFPFSFPKQPIGSVCMPYMVTFTINKNPSHVSINLPYIRIRHGICKVWYETMTGNLHKINHCQPTSEKSVRFFSHAGWMAVPRLPRVTCCDGRAERYHLRC